MSDTSQTPQSFASVDRAEYIAWCNGVLFNFNYGRGVIVNEPEAIAADEALARGEPVLLREGGRMIGRYFKVEGGILREFEGYPQ